MYDGFQKIVNLVEFYNWICKTEKSKSILTWWLQIQNYKLSSKLIIVFLTDDPLKVL